MADDLRPAIAAELYTALDRLGVDVNLMAIVGSYGDTLDDADVLRLLKNYNDTGTVFKTVVCEV